MKFRTHAGETIEGERLEKAVDAVATWYAGNARAVHERDEYSSHVTSEKKHEILCRNLDEAEAVRRGERMNNFSVWQRINTHLTGECVAFLQS